MQDYIVVGDVHGCFEELCELLEKCHYNPTKHHLIFVGDILNKGPYSKDCYSFVTLTPNTRVVLGNHEKHWRDNYENGSYLQYRSFSQMAEKWSPQFCKEVSDWTATLPTYIKLENLIILHAGLHPDRGLKNATLKDLTEIRTAGSPPLPWHHYYNGKETIVYGHWAQQGLHRTHNTIGLDSGCVYGRKLSALLWPDGNIVQVEAKKIYSAPMG